MKTKDDDKPSMQNEWAVGALAEKSVPNRTNEELTQIAKDIVGNLIFTSNHLRESETRMIPQIFMPIIFGTFAESTKEYIDDIGLIFEYYSKAGPTSINGLPVFFSCSYISRHDAAIVGEKVKKIQDMLKEI